MAAASSTPTTGTATPLELDPEEASKSLKVSLADLSAKATALYAHKKYEEAAEVFAQAAEMQAEMNGEMNPENAEILFLYGRALFKVGQSKSDVLGGKAPDVKKPAKPKPAKQAESANGSGPAAATEEKKKKKEKEKEEPKPEQKKALFQFEGDEDFDDSDDSDEGDEDEDEEEDDDDLAVAFEVLDLARVLFNKRLEAAQAEDEARQGKGKAVAGEEGDSAAVRHIKERLADTHDLLAEISLENERYPNAITDSRASLKYKQELYPFESEVIAEAHFKLSLALEFASVTRSSDDDDDNGKDAAAGGIDQALRDEAAAELEAAINSTRQKLRNKEVELATLHNPDENEATRRQIADVKEVLADMEQRLVDLRKPPVDLSAALGIPPPAAVAGGGGGAGAGAAPAAVSDEIRSKATDLTGLVRKKRKADDEKPAGDEVEVKKARDAN